MSAISEVFRSPVYVSIDTPPLARLVWSFRYWRGQATRTATMALFNARKDVLNGKTRYPLTCGMGAPFKIGRDTCRHVEKPADYGFRMVDYADKVARHIQHTGWYLEDDYSNETARGVVFQIPAAKGKPRYVAGIADPFNDGAAIIALEVTDDENTAARWADHIAESYAETERDYRRANAARHRFEDLAADIKAARDGCRALISEARKACAALSGMDTIKATIRDHIASYRRDITRAAKERADLQAAFARCNGWQDY